jgi:MipA family protein
MSLSLRASRLALVLLAGLSAQISYADEPVLTKGESASNWALGIGVAVQQQAYRGISNRVTPFPLVKYENSWVRVFGNTLDVKAPTFSDQFSVSLRASLDIGQGYKASDSRFLRGMHTRNGSIWIGPAATWRAPWFEVSADWDMDASGKSKGHQANLTLQRSFVITHRLDVTPHIGANWLDKKYVDYYYGVRPNEIRVNRPAYLGGSTINTQAGVRIGYNLTSHQHLLLDLSATMLGSKIKDSPLVHGKTEASVLFGYFYTF